MSVIDDAIQRERIRSDFNYIFFFESQRIDASVLFGVFISQLS